MDDYSRLIEMLVNKMENKNSNNKSLQEDNHNLHKASNSNNTDSCFFSLGANQFTGLATLLGFVIANTLTVDQQNSMGNFIELVGQTVLTISAQNSTLQSTNNSNNVADQLALMKKQIELIEKSL